MILVKLVIITKIDGASVRTVITASICKLKTKSFSPLLSPSTFIEMFGTGTEVPDCDRVGSAAKTDRIIKIKNL